MKPNKFPRKLSDAIEFAANHMVEIMRGNVKFKVERKEYPVELNMGEWITIDREFGVCEVCMAGAALIGLFDKRNIHLVGKEVLSLDTGAPNDFVANKAIALDQIRCGNFISAASRWYGREASIKVSDALFLIPKKNVEKLREYAKKLNMHRSVEEVLQAADTVANFYRKMDL